MTDRPITRRECLARGAGAAVAAGLAAAGGFLLHDREGRDPATDLPSAGGLRDFFAGIDFPAGSPRIAVVVGHEQRIRQMVQAALAALDPELGLKRFVGRGDVVLIKPNVGFDRPPHLGATTHPEVLRWVIRLCREAGASRVMVTDNPIESPQACFAKSGIGPVVQAEGAELVLPASGRFRVLAPWPDPAGQQATAASIDWQRWPLLWEPLDQATRLIGLAPVKDHNLAGGSMALKNWYGFLGGRRSQLHQAIHEAISDLALLLSPTLVIADATRVMMRSGPTGGRLSDVSPGGKLGRPVLVASVDPVACDSWCYQNLLDRDPAGLPYLELAARKIQSQIRAGRRRFGQSDWRVYGSEGRIATISV